MNERNNLSAATPAPPAPFLRRLFARLVDLVAFHVAVGWVEAGILWTFFGLDRREWADAVSAACHACGDWTWEQEAEEWLHWPCLNAPAMLEGLVLLAGMAALEAVFLSGRGWTPGTWLARIRRTAADGRRLSFSIAFRRSLRVIAPFLVLFWLPFFLLPDWAESGALLLGLALCLLDPAWQSLRLASGSPASWDARFGSAVTARPRPGKRD